MKKKAQFAAGGPPSSPMSVFWVSAAGGRTVCRGSPRLTGLTLEEEGTRGSGQELGGLSGCRHFLLSVAVACEPQSRARFLRFSQFLPGFAITDCGPFCGPRWRQAGFLLLPSIPPSPGRSVHGPAQHTTRQTWSPRFSEGVMLPIIC